MGNARVQFTVEFEVEVLDEVKLRESDLHVGSDQNGELGLMDVSLAERVASAILRQVNGSVREVEADIGVQLLSAWAEDESRSWRTGTFSAGT
jgi:hypothetical protein